MSHWSTAPLEALDLLRRMEDTATELGIVTRHPGWIEKLSILRMQRADTLKIHPLKLRWLGLKEREAGGYWIDTGGYDGTLRSGIRFIPRDTCVKCQTVKSAHLDTGQCLFAPGSSFEETKP